MFCFKTEIISMVSACLIARKYLLSNKNQEYFARFHRNGLITDVFFIIIGFLENLVLSSECVSNMSLKNNGYIKEFIEIP